MYIKKGYTPKNERLEPGTDGETKFGISFSKGPPFSGAKCLFWGVYIKKGKSKPPHF